MELCDRHSGRGVVCGSGWARRAVGSVRWAVANLWGGCGRCRSSGVVRLWTTRVAVSAGLASVVGRGRRGAAGKGRMERRTGSTRRTGARGGRGAGRAAAAAAVGVALVLVTAGCESDPPPTPTPTPKATSASPPPSPSASTPSPSPTDNPIPTAARENSEAGAKAFVEYFFTQFNASWTEPRPGLVEAISDPECRFCKKAEDTAGYLEKEGQRYRTDPARLLSSEIFGGAPDGEQFVAVDVEQQRSEILDSSGKAIHTDPKREESFYVTLRWRADRWTMLELERTE